MNTVLAYEHELPRFAADNDNTPQKDGKHFWPARDRLKSGKLMRSNEANAAGLRTLHRFASDLADGRTGWAVFGDSSGVDADVAKGFDEDLDIEFATPEHILALHMAGALEYRVIDGATVAVKIAGKKAYQLDDRLRGEKGPAKPEHSPSVKAELNGRYSGADWPSAPGAPRTAGELFLGATMAARPSPRVWRNDVDEPALASMYARRATAFVKGALPSALWEVAEAMVEGATAEEIGERRGHNGKYASAVGTELQRIALESVAEAYADFDAT